MRDVENNSHASTKIDTSLTSDPPICHRQGIRTRYKDMLRHSETKEVRLLYYLPMTFVCLLQK